MSGFLPEEIRSWPSVSTATEFLVPHGDNDEVLSQSSSIRANEFLLSKGITSEFREYRGRHKMSLDIVRYVNEWILKLSCTSDSVA
jgi:predicted esterase